MPSVSVVNDRCSTSSLGASKTCDTLAEVRMAGADEEWRCRYCELKAFSETTVGFRAAMEASRIDLTSSGTSLTEATATKRVGKPADVDTRNMDDRPFLASCTMGTCTSGWCGSLKILVRNTLSAISQRQTRSSSRLYRPCQGTCPPAPTDR
jgi:hypothetical protein